MSTDIVQWILTIVRMFLLNSQNIRTIVAIHWTTSRSFLDLQSWTPAHLWVTDFISHNYIQLLKRKSKTPFFLKKITIYKIKHLYFIFSAPLLCVLINSIDLISTESYSFLSLWLLLKTQLYYPVLYFHRHPHNTHLPIHVATGCHTGLLCGVFLRWNISRTTSHLWSLPLRQLGRGFKDGS